MFNVYIFTLNEDVLVRKNVNLYVWSLDSAGSGLLEELFCKCSVFRHRTTYGQKANGNRIFENSPIF